MNLEELKYSLAQNKKLILAIFAVLVIAVVAFLLLFSPKVQKANLDVLVYDKAGKAIENATVSIEGIGASTVTNSNGAARLEVVLGKVYLIHIEKKGFASRDEEVKVDKLSVRKEYFLDLRAITQSMRAISFSDSTGKSLAGKKIDVGLSCTNNSVSFPEGQGSMSTATGEINVTPPANCGFIKVRASALGFKEISTTIDSSGIIRLEAFEGGKGNLKMLVSADASGDVPETIKVSVYGSDDAKVDYSYLKYGGYAFFALPVGTYYAVVSDDEGDYGSTELRDIEIKEKQVTNEEVTLSKQLKIRLTIKVLEKGNNAAIAGASVFLSKGSKAYLSDETGADGVSEFALFDAGVYGVRAAKDGYIAGDGNEVDSSDYAVGEDVNSVVYLERCTPSTCGTVKVRVIDEDSLPVFGAKVSLFDSGKDFLLEGYGSSYTDLNGYSENFRNVKKASYYAMAYKYPASGKSDVFEADPVKQNEIEMTLRIGEGTVNATIKDEDNKPVPFAGISIYYEDGKPMGKIKADAEGYGYKVLKADKRVYLKINAEGYLPYTTVARQIMPNSVVSYGIMLEKDVLEKVPSIKLLGMLNDKGNETSTLRAGKTYTAKLRFTIPSGNYSEAGIFLMAGAQNSLEKDMVYINSLNAPSSWQQKGKIYSPPNGQAVDFASLTTGKAKWVLASWTGTVAAGIYEAEAEIKVDKICPPGYALPLYYRAYAKSSGSVIRDPADSALGSAEETAAKQALYAESYVKPYVEGAESMCSDDICFGTRLLDVDEGIYIGEDDYFYEVTNYGDYNLSFSLSNNSSTVHDNATLEIMNSEEGGLIDESIAMEGYSFENANGISVSGSNEIYKTPKMNMGRFSQYKGARGNLMLKPKKTGSAELRFRMISSSNEIEIGTVSFISYAEGDLNVSVNPNVLPALMPSDLNVSVKYTDEKRLDDPVEGASVDVEIKQPGIALQKFSKTTNAMGKADFRIPVLLPGAKVRVAVYKRGFPRKYVEKEITDEIVNIAPEKLEFTVNVMGGRDDQKDLDIRKLITAPIKIKEIRFAALNEAVLDEEKMNAKLAEYRGKRIIGLDEISSIGVVAALGSEASLLTEPVVLKGSIIIKFSPVYMESALWQMNIPVEITVNLGELPKNSPCIVISDSKWEDATTSNRAQKRFYIQNNCINENNEPMGLKNLQGTIAWTGEGIPGNVELTVIDSITGETHSEILQSAIWSTLLENMENGIEYSAILTFVPKGNALGKTAEFEVSIDGQVLTNSGMQFAGAQPKVIRGNIKVINLEECIVIDPNPRLGVKIERSGKDAEFSVDVSECGPINIDLRFCGGNSNDRCRGGTDKGGITLSQWELKGLKGTENSSTHTVKVSRGSLPGYYGIKVEARTQNSSQDSYFL